MDPDISEMLRPHVMHAQMREPELVPQRSEEGVMSPCDMRTSTTPV